MRSKLLVAAAALFLSGSMIGAASAQSATTGAGTDASDDTESLAGTTCAQLAEMSTEEAVFLITELMTVAQGDEPEQAGDANATSSANGTEDQPGATPGESTSDAASADETPDAAGSDANAVGDDVARAGDGGGAVSTELDAEAVLDACLAQQDVLAIDLITRLLGAESTEAPEEDAEGATADSDATRP